MSYCKYCGKELAAGEEHKCPDRPKFTRFISWLFNRSGVENPFKDKREIYEREQKITPDCIALEDGEIPVKQYNIGILRSRMRFQRSEGRLQITNKRVLFRATGYSPAGKTTFLLTIPTCTVLPIGFTQTTAPMFVWSPRANIGFPCLTFSKNAISVSPLPIPSG